VGSALATLAAVSNRRWQWSALAGALVVAVAAVAWLQFRVRPLGAPIVTPAPGRVSMKVGDVTMFTASADHANLVTWSLWGRPVAQGATWSYVPGPEDAGWQQISVEIVGDADQRAVRTWDIGVVPAVPPELTDISPPPGVVTVPPGQPVSIRVAARVPAAREEDRIIFEWSVDGHLVLREERGAGRGASEFAPPLADPGSHRIVVRVSENKRSASLVEWALDVSPGAPPQVAVVPPPPEETPPVQPPIGPPLAPRVVRLSGSRSLAVESGEPVSLSIGLEPADAGAAYQWSVDGKRVAAASKPEFEYEPDRPGRHRVTVSVVFGERMIGGDAWTIQVREPVQVAEAAPEVTSSTLPPAPVNPSTLPPMPVTPSTLPPTPVTPSTVPPAPVTPSTLPPVPVTPPTVPPAPVTPSTLPVAEAPPPSEPAATEEMIPAGTIPREEPVVVARAPSTLESDVRAWMAEYARAWSRKDVDALRAMGQVRSPSEVEKLERYFRSVGDLRVDVTVLSVTVDGGRASVEFERTDTVTDPSGRRQELRLPAIRKEIERAGDGLRFTIVSTELKGAL
jgi:hypothetical protein